MFRQHGAGLNTRHGQTQLMLDLMLGPVNADQQGANKVTLYNQEMLLGCLLQAPISKMFQSFPVTPGLLDRALTQHKWLSLEVQRRQMVAVMSPVIQLFLEELLWCCVLLYKHDLEITGLRFRQSACVSFLCATEHVSVPSWGQPLWTGVYLGA